MTHAQLEAEVAQLRATVESLAKSCAELIPEAIVGAAYLSAGGAVTDATIQRVQRILLEIGDSEPDVAELIAAKLSARGLVVKEMGTGDAP